MSESHTIHRNGTNRPQQVNTSGDEAGGNDRADGNDHIDGIAGNDRIEVIDRIDGIEPVIHLSRKAVPEPRRLIKWIGVFRQVHIAASYACPESLRGKVNWYHYGLDEPVAAIWNHMLMHVTSDRALFLLDDETVDLQELAAIAGHSGEMWIPTKIQWPEGGFERHCYQVRLVPATAKHPFEGMDLPDATRYIMANGGQNGGQLAECPVSIMRGSDPFGNIVVEKELSTRYPAAQLHLVTGIRHFEAGRYVHAAAQFRRVIQSTSVLLFDKVAAVNGLASCKAEQYKWTRAVELAEESIRLQPSQQLPYLILFRIHQLAKRWTEAHEILEACFHVHGRRSEASFDKSLPEQELLSLMGDMAFRAGKRNDSFRHYRHLYELLKGGAPHDLTERLLLLALEENEYELSMDCFQELFGDPDSGTMDEYWESAVFDYLGHFMENGWYEFASGYYERMMQQKPENEVYKRRWVVALSKSKDIEKARSLLTCIRAGWKRKAVAG